MAQLASTTPLTKTAVRRLLCGAHIAPLSETKLASCCLTAIVAEVIEKHLQLEKCLKLLDPAVLTSACGITMRDGLN